MTRRRWIADEWDQTSAVLRNAQAAHLARVLRAQVGQEFDIVAGTEVRRGVIENIREDAVELSLHETLDATTCLPLVLALSIIRFERMEWAIEKLTELGVARIVPLIAQRTEKHLAQAAQKRTERWRKIAHESAQQSRRSDVPEITDPIPVSNYLSAGPDALHLLLSEHERARSLRGCLENSDGPEIYSPTAPRTICAAIGPEGGWTDGEVVSFAKYGWQSVSLGSRILRAETAAIAVASVLSSWLGP